MTALSFLLAKYDFDIIWGFGEDGKYVFVCLDVYSEKYNCHRINIKRVVIRFANKAPKSVVKH